MSINNLSFEDVVNNTQLVVLECPWENWESSDVREMYSKMALLKKRGYGPRWAKGMMPVDSTDLIGDHIIACYVNPEGEYIPYTAARSIAYNKCVEYNLEYPPINYFKTIPNSEDCIKLTENYIKEKYKTEKKVSYYSSWTIDPLFRDIDNKFLDYSKDLFSGMTFWFHEHYSISDFFCFGVVKFKTDLFFEKWGCKTVISKSKELPVMSIPRYSDYGLKYMHLDGFSEQMSFSSRKYKDLWDKRVTMNLAYESNKPIEYKDAA